MISAKGKDFNEWHDEMQRIIVQFPGLLNKEVFLPENKTGQVTTILRFDKMNNAKKWIDSEQRLGMLQKASEQILTDIDKAVHSKSFFWFKEVSETKVRKKWKQVLVTFVAVFPLTLIVPRFTNLVIMPCLPDHWLLSSAVTAFLFVLLMVFFVMPFMVRATRKWLD